MRIIQTATRNMRLEGDFDFKRLARNTPGFVGADLQSLSKEAAAIAIDRIFHNAPDEDLRVTFAPSSTRTTTQSTESTGDKTSSGASGESSAGGRVIAAAVPLTAEQMEPLYITMDDFLNAVPLVQPSSQREGFATVPDVSWQNIGALQSIREELSITVLEPIRNPEKFEALVRVMRFGISSRAQTFTDRWDLTVCCSLLFPTSTRDSPYLLEFCCMVRLMLLIVYLFIRCLSSCYGPILILTIALFFLLQARLVGM